MEEKLKVAYYSGVIEATETLVEGFKKKHWKKRRACRQLTAWNF